MRYLKNPASTRSEPALDQLLRPIETAASGESSSAPSTAGSSDAAPTDDVIDVAGVGKMLRIGRNTLYEMVARNEIPHRRFGRRIRFSRTAVMRWLDSWSLQGAKERQ